jgi:predicted DNA-binding transcriptional regulator AlpA
MTDELLTIDKKLNTLLHYVTQLGNRHLTRHEMAERLGVSPATIDRRAKAGSIPAPVNGRWVLSAVVEWENQQASQPKRRAS